MMNKPDFKHRFIHLFISLSVSKYRLMAFEAILYALDIYRTFILKKSYFPFQKMI